MSHFNDRRLLEALGGESGCKHLAKEFYARVATDPDLRPLFPGKSLRCATEEFSAFLVQLLDGDEERMQYRWWLSLRESHARFEISEQQKVAWLRLMGETLDSVVDDCDLRSALAQFFSATADYLGGKSDASLEHPDLCMRLRGQQDLDQVIDHIVRGEDAMAMVLSRQFMSRPSVFVGILARMMESGRETLAQFVLECITYNHHLASSRFNGRTLLHFAARHSCFPVTEQLLDLGVDPNVLDWGGHSPLYRAAASESDEVAAAIVRALVEAGARVDQAFGVNRSSALHEAARHGNLHVARALLDAGADTKVKDKNGYTALDRANHCRKHEVAALLNSR